MRTLHVTAQPSALLSAGAERFGRFLRKIFFPVAAIFAALSSPATAQQPQVINHGQVAVTGYSGSVAVAPPAGADPFDYLRIKVDGPSARVVDVRVLGPQGQLSNVPEPFTITAGQSGQVLGVALDNAPQPNVYVAATAAYGLAISVIDPMGQPKRVRKGEPGAQWMAGQFGPPALGGGPGSIWRIDGISGAVSLFANIDNASFGAASLGALAFDPTTRQIFAVDRASGLIHRFSLDGVQRGTYDHGTEGRGPAGLPPVPSPGMVPINIGSPAFDTENPSTWAFAAPARRVFGLAVRNSRLYYSVAQGPQIWSVGISPSGAVAAGPRIEVEVPSLQDGVEIASIAFDGQGRMYLAERGATTGDYFRYYLANGGASRVLRYVPKAPGDPSPGLWRLVPDQYSVGMPPIHANANGGVALGWGYRPDNVIDFNSCGATVWSTGERLLDPGNPAAPPDSFPRVDGLQGNSTSLIQPQNTPPAQSWFIDYDGLNGDPNYRGHMGAIAILPCPGQPQAAPPPPPPPPVSCPPGTYFYNGQCVIIPTCPPGTHYQSGQCVYDTCPPGTYFINGQCKPPPVVCPPGTFFYQGQCYPIDCPPGLVKLPNGQCTCPPGNIYFNGQCVPPQNCPPGMVELPGGICWCPLGTIFGNGFCQPSDCPQDQIMDHGFCKPCPDGQIAVNNACVPEPCPQGQEKFQGECVPKCDLDEFRAPDGTCKPFELCLPPNEVWNHQCVPKCDLDEFRAPNGTCKGFELCLPPNEVWNNQCVPKCDDGQVHQPPNGACAPGDLADQCPQGQEMWNGACVDVCPLGQARQPDGSCGMPDDLGVACIPPQEKVNDVCVDPCPLLEFRQPDGSCAPGQLILCIFPMVNFNGQCVDPCPPLQFRQPDGTCKGLDLDLPILPIPPIIIDPPLPPPPDPLPPPPVPPVFDPGIILPPGGLKLPPIIGTPPTPPPPEPPPVINPGFKLPGLTLPGFKLPGLIVTPPPTEEPPPTPPTTTPPLTVNPGLLIAPGTLKVAPAIKTAPPVEEPPPTVDPQFQLTLPPGMFKVPVQ